MKSYYFIILLLLFSCKEESIDGQWFVQNTNAVINISKSNDKYIVDINGNKLIGERDGNTLSIDNQGQIIKGLLTENGELIIDGKTATRTNPNASSLFDEKSPANDVKSTPSASSTTNASNFGNAIIKGNRVIFRESFSTTSKSIGNLNNNESILILDEYSPENYDEAITKRTIRLYNSVGESVHSLPKGKAVQILSEDDNEYNVLFKHPTLGNLNATIIASDLEFISGEKWYKIKRSNGDIGWVFSKFVNR